MTKNQKTHYSKKGNQPQQSVSYEEIMEIMKKRHDFERFGDNDIM